MIAELFQSSLKVSKI